MYRIERLDRTHQVDDFDCGDEPLNTWLKQYASQNQRRDAAVVYLILEEKRVIGYYVLAAGSVEYARAPARVVKGLGHYPVPVMLLARLAVSVSWQGQDIGKELIRDVMLRTLQASGIAGIRAILAHAKNDNAKAFYIRFGFEPSPTDPYHMYILLKDIRLTLGMDR